MNKTMTHRFAKGLRLTLVRTCRVLLLTLGILLILTPTLVSSAPPWLDEGVNDSSPTLASMSQRSDADTPPPGLTAEAWARMMATIREDLRRSRYLITPLAGENAYRARNPANGLLATFSPAGVQVGSETEEWAWRLSLTGYGYAGAIQPVAEARLAVAENRIEYRRGAITEWYNNGEQGLEQGFTLQLPPLPGSERRPGGEGSLLHLAMALHTSLTPRLADNGQAIQFTDHEGGTVLRYDQLHVHDAAGRQLPARMDLMSKPLVLSRTDPQSRAKLVWPISIVVDDTNATYPITVDPLVTAQVAKLTATDGAANDYFGVSVAISGGTVVVGADGAYVGGKAYHGAAYVFEPLTVLLSHRDMV
jgi:hypothetical protein